MDDLDGDPIGFFCNLRFNSSKSTSSSDCYARVQFSVWNWCERRPIHVFHSNRLVFLRDCVRAAWVFSSFPIVVVGYVAVFSHFYRHLRVGRR